MRIRCVSHNSTRRWKFKWLETDCQQTKRTFCEEIMRHKMYAFYNEQIMQMLTTNNKLNKIPLKQFGNMLNVKCKYRANVPSLVYLVTCAYFRRASGRSNIVA